MATAKLLFNLYEHWLALVSVIDGLQQAVEGAAAVVDSAHLGVAAHEDAALGVLGGVAAVDADAVVVGHADEQGQPTFELWAHRHHDRIAAFGNGGLALGLAAAVVEVDPVRLKGITEIGPRGEHSALTAADAEATDGIGRSLRKEFTVASNIVSAHLRARSTGDFTRAELTSAAQMQEADAYDKGTSTDKTATPAAG